MRGVNLKLFRFDYDLTWAALFMNADGKTYGRYGGRDAGDAERYLTLSGLKHAMRTALVAYRRDPNARPDAQLEPAEVVDAFPAARALAKNECIHCHQVYDFRREALQAAGKWSLDRIWVHPPPESVGMTLDRNAGDRVIAVTPKSSAAIAGVLTGDRLRRVNGQPIASYADVRYALEAAPKQGRVPVTWRRGERDMQSELPLSSGWRQSDLSWRASMWGLGPTPSVHGDDLPAEERRRLGLSLDQLAFRQGKFVTAQARGAGIREGDLIVGFNGGSPAPTVVALNVYVRLHHRVGERVTFTVLRDGKKVDLEMILAEKATW